MSPSPIASERLPRTAGPLDHALSELQGLALALVDEMGCISQANAGFGALTGLRPSQLKGCPVASLHSLPRTLLDQLAKAAGQPDPLWQEELRCPTPEGDHLYLWQIQRLHSAGPARRQLVLCGTDLGPDAGTGTGAESQELQSEVLHTLVYEDELTGLSSRYALRERLMSLIERREEFGLLAIKPRDFSLLRDNFGPDGADEVLVAVASALKTLLPAPAVVARSLGVEFTVLMPGPGGIEEMQRLGRMVLQRFTQPLSLKRTELVVPVSIGIACHPLHGVELEELLRNADTALHSAQEDGGRTQRVYDPRMQQRARERLWLDHHLRKALELQQLELHYQPKLDLRTGHCLGVEALLRWRHPKRGLIRPDLFIARAEDNGQIAAIGRWVIVSAASQAAQWRAQGLPTRIAVNISARQFQDADLLRWLSECQRAAHGLLDVELTESSVIGDPARTAAFMQECRALGYKVFLDDFGTGFSSLAMLARLPIDVIKLDRSFLKSGPEQERSEALMKSVVSVAKELNLSIVAEGVETIAQEAFLRDIGVHTAQGWLYAVAMPPAEYPAWLQSRQRR